VFTAYSPSGGHHGASVDFVWHAGIHRPGRRSSLPVLALMRPPARLDSFFSFHKGDALSWFWRSSLLQIAYMLFAGGNRSRFMVQSIESFPPTDAKKPKHSDIEYVLITSLALEGGCCTENSHTVPVPEQPRVPIWPKPSVGSKIYPRSLHYVLHTYLLD
jgi:hypothetical protein